MTRLATLVRGAGAAAAAAVAAAAAGCGGSDAVGDDIVFVSSRGGDYALYGMEADGSEQGRLTEDEGEPSTPAGLAHQVDPAWSPDGRRIAFASGRDGPSHLFVVAADGTGLRRLTNTREDDGEPTWSPDGARLAFQRGDDGRIVVMRAGGGEARRLTRGDAPAGDPAWSPNGRWIAYSRRLRGTEVRELWLVRPDGGGARQLTRLRGVSLSPAWSPDGRTLAFAASRGSRYEIYVVGVDGTGLRRLTRSSEDAFEPAWSPDGETLAFSRGGAIVTVDEEGDEVQLTDPVNNDSSPAWNPAPPDEEEDG